MPDDCIFCRIASGDAPATIVYQDEDCLVFKDIRPAAPVHLLVVPRKHIASLADVGPEDEALLGKLLMTVHKVAKEQGLDEAGYRTVINTGSGAGQVVFHLHLHLLSGRRMPFP